MGIKAVPGSYRQIALERLLNLYETWGKPEKAAAWRANKDQVTSGPNNSESAPAAPTAR
jgi:hypothetical protein